MYTLHTKKPILHIFAIMTIQSLSHKPFCNYDKAVSLLAQASLIHLQSWSACFCSLVIVQQKSDSCFQQIYAPDKNQLSYKDYLVTGLKRETIGKETGNKPDFIYLIDLYPKYNNSHTFIYIQPFFVKKLTIEHCMI